MPAEVQVGNNPFAAVNPSNDATHQPMKKRKGVSKGNNNKQGGENKTTQPAAVKKDMDKQAPKQKAERRMDPSDGNGPFTYASFIKFHGEEKGKELWEQGEGIPFPEDGKKKMGPKKERKPKENADAPANPFEANETGNEEGAKERQPMKKMRKKGNAAPQNPLGQPEEEQQVHQAPAKGGNKGGKKGAKGEGKKGGLFSGNKGEGKKGKAQNKGGKDGKGKGKGKGVQKQGEKQTMKNKVEKRRDPSDGNGPFTYQSFIKFHGQEKGDMLWKQAAE